jgi:hypothetical protein
MILISQRKYLVTLSYIIEGICLDVEKTLLKSLTIMVNSMGVQILRNANLI